MTDYVEGQACHSIRSYGLTKREYFAALAMQGMCARSYPADKQWDKPFVEYVQKAAVEVADAMIAELSHPKEGSGKEG